jgi:hypothetical protein
MATLPQACGALLAESGVRVHGAAAKAWENLKTDGFVESHPNAAKDATLGWGTQRIRNGKGKITLE